MATAVMKLVLSPRSQRPMDWLKAFTKFVCTAVAVCFCFVALRSANAQSQFMDDFSDPCVLGQTWIPIDSSVVMNEMGEPTGDLREWGPGVIELRDGALRLQTTNPVPVSDPQYFGNRNFFDSSNVGTTGVGWGPSFVVPVEDVVVRGQVKVGTETNAGFAVRSDLATLSNYNFTAAGAQGEFAMSRFTNGIMERVEFFEGPTFDVGETWWMEGSAIGDRISLKVWEDGSPEPATPQWTWVDDVHTSGQVGVFGVVQNNMVPEPTNVDATFDDISISVLDAPLLPTEFADSDFVGWGTSPVNGLPGNLAWTVVDTSIFAPGFVPRPEPEAWGPAVVTTTDGVLNIKSTNPVPVSDPAVYEKGDRTVFPIEGSGFTNVIWNPSLQTPVADATIRTKVNVSTDSQVSVLFRVAGAASGYTATASGAIDEFGLSKFEDGVMTRVEFTDSMEFQDDEEWWMEASAIGDQITLRAWPDGEDRPDEPTLSWTDDSFAGGFIAMNGIVWRNNVDGPTTLDVTFDDISITGVTPLLFCAPANALAGDLNGDGTVAFTDFLMLANNFGEQVATYREGDVNCDGEVAFTDFLQLANNFGKTLEQSAAAAVPEPAGLLLGSLALLVTLFGRRRRSYASAS